MISDKNPFVLNVQIFYHLTWFLESFEVPIITVRSYVQFFLLLYPDCGKPKNEVEATANTV